MVQARYRYAFDGRSHEGTRVGIHRTGSDNIGTWQRDWHERLADAQASGRPVTAWVDPHEPGRSMLDRGVRWSMVALHIPFALIFPVVSGFATRAFWRLLRLPAQELARASPLRPSTGRRRKLEGRALWQFAGAWCVVSWPMAALVWLEPAPWMPRTIVSLFALLGLWLLAKAWQGASLPARA
jgi:hypothetical protein